MPRRRGYRRSDSEDLYAALKIIEEELFKGPRYPDDPDSPMGRMKMREDIAQARYTSRKPKRKLSAWNKYVKANSKKPRFRYRNGKLNLKKMAVAFRKTPAGKKKRR